MPELPAVERGRRLAERVGRGARIVSVWCATDPIVFPEDSPATLRRRLRGRRVMAVGRRGKHLWLELDERPWPLFHFGMTGAFRVQDEEGMRYRGGGPEPDPCWPPKYSKLRLTFEHGGELAFTDPRRFGRLRLRRDPLTEPPVSELGFDPLLDPPSAAAWYGQLARRRAPIKAVLLDQGVAAGVGNWIADEVLYQARVAPMRPAADLTPAECRRVLAKLRYVVEKAVAVDAIAERFPRTWLFHHRWGKQADARSARGERIRHDRIGGRTTAWVPSRQR